MTSIQISIQPPPFLIGIPMTQGVVALQPPEPPVSQPPVSQPPVSQPKPPQQSFFLVLLATMGHLANLLPTGTVLAFQLLAPVFSDHGSCGGDPVSHALTGGLIAALAAFCFFASFTDSLRTPDGSVYYGFATTRGLWLLNCPPESGVPVDDLRRYRLRPVDFVHATMSALLFCVVAVMRNADVVSCFFPDPAEGIRRAIEGVPLGVGLICGVLFAAFPTTRHGIGYPS